MKAIIYNWHTEIFPNDEEVKQICKPGCGADTCVWLVAGANGFECTNYNKPHALMDRFHKGLTNAKRDGCEEIKAFEPMRYEEREVEFNLIGQASLSAQQIGR